MAQCWVPYATPQKEPGPSKVILPTDHTWLGIRKSPPNIWRLHWGVACIAVSCPQSLEPHVIEEKSTPNTQSDLIQQLAALSHNNIISYLFMEMLFHMSFSLYHSSNSMATTCLLWAYWLHKRSSFIILAIEGLNNRNPSYFRRYSLLSIIPATEGLSSRKPSYRWGYLLSIIPATKGLNSRKPSYCWRYSLLSIIPAIEGLNSRKPSYCWGYSLLSIIPAIEGLNGRNPSYCWRSSLLSVIPAIEGPSSRNLSYCWGSPLLSFQRQMDSAVEVPRTAGQIYYYPAVQ